MKLNKKNEFENSCIEKDVRMSVYSANNHPLVTG